jgi:hypothetical protein
MISRTEAIVTSLQKASVTPKDAGLKPGMVFFHDLAEYEAQIERPEATAQIGLR